MGISYSVYLGPYIQTISTPVPVLQKIVKCSKDTSHFPSYSANFCDQCGSSVKITNVDTGKTQASSAARIVAKEMIQDRLFCMASDADAFYWVPNVAWQTSTNRLTFLGEVVLPVDADLIKSELLQFSNFFRLEIETLEHQFEKVSVKWGAIGSYS